MRNKKNPQESDAELTQESKHPPKHGRTKPFILGSVAISPKQALVIGSSILVVIVFILWFVFHSPQQKEQPEKPSPQAQDQGQVLAPLMLPEKPQTVPPPGTAAVNAQDLPSIRTIKITPPQPTKLDTLKAEIIPGSTIPAEQMEFTYKWKLNDRIIEDATGDSLNLSKLKKRDLITVTATPYVGGKAGFPFESPVIAVHSAPPSLDLKALPRQQRKISDPLELQLTSVDPDGDEVTFYLEVPLVEGMTIDSRTGKITWIIQPNQKGAIRFGAAAEDTDKTKVTKIFEITVE